MEEVKQEAQVSEVVSPQNVTKTYRLPQRFSAENKLSIRQLDSKRYYEHLYWSFFQHYTREDIKRFLKNPALFEKELRKAICYIYNVSPHFRRLILYFAGLTDWDYIVSPYKLDTGSVSEKTVKRNYQRVQNLLSTMDIPNQFYKILLTVLREDVFYGTIREASDMTTIQRLPSDYCMISTVMDNVFNVAFDFSYFDTRPDLLETYTPEFQEKYNLYKTSNMDLRWQELDAPWSFAIKFNKDTPEFVYPPFAGILREIFDIEQYKDMKQDREQIDNYAMLAMYLEQDDQNRYKLDYNSAVEFWKNLDGVLPDEIGSILTPMKVEKISFERNHTGETDAVAESEQELFTAAGVSSLLFNNSRASANALNLSIKADQALTYSVVKSLETMVNRLIHFHGYGKYFRVNFLDISTYNRKEMSDVYLKAATYGVPTVMHYAVSQGLAQDDVEQLAFLQNNVLELHDQLIPLRSSATMSGSEETEDVGGRPQSEDTELTEAGENSRERGEY